MMAVRLRLPVLVLLALALVSTAGAQGTPLEKRLARALVVPHVSQARTAALAFDLQTGETLFSEHESLSLAPASNEKLAVTYAALAGLGPEFRIETDVVGRGEQDGTVWRGTLLLVGQGDPTLSSRGLASLATQIRAAGITRVTGGVLGDESFFDSRRTGPGWKRWFYANESPPLSALTVDRARYAGRTSRNPPLSAALLFRAALRRAGVYVAGGAGTGVEHGDELPLASLESPPLAAIVRWMDRQSDNFTAELLLKQLGTEISSSRDHGFRRRRTWRRRSRRPGSRSQACGSPTGPGSRCSIGVTVREQAGILRAAWADPDVRPSFFAAFPVAGRSGTLSDRMRRPPARGHVVAKTGSTQQASALSGYVKRRYIFSIVQNGNPVSWTWARRAQDRFATVLAGQ